MKRLLIVLLILIILGGIIFGFGYLPLRLGAGEVAVIFTKTGGWETEVLRPGTFTWRWQALVPTNLSLERFTLEPVGVDYRVSGNLPGSDLYAGSLEGVRFDYLVSGEVLLLPDAESLPGLLDEGIDLRDEETLAAIRARVRETAESEIQDVLDENTTPDRTELRRSLQNAISQAVPELRISSLVVEQMRLPDLELYALTRNEFFALIADSLAEAREASLAAASQLGNEAQRLQILQDYAEVLTSYPVLLDYFQLSDGLGRDPLGLEDLRPAAPQ